MRTVLSVMLCVALAAAQPPGGQDVEVSGLVINGGEAAAPKVGLGAPMYSPEQTASYVCVAEAEGRGLAEAQRAHEATLKARELRVAARDGGASRGDVADAERERQAAVRALTGGDNPLAVGFGAIGALAGLFSSGEEESSGSDRGGVDISDVQTRRVLENGRAVLVVSGQVRNTNAERTEVLPLSIAAKDARDFTLASQSNMLDKAWLEPGERTAFSVRFKNPPQYTAHVEVRFSRFLQTRNFRGCDFFDPMVFNPRQIEVARARATAQPVPPPQVGQGAAAYTAKELAILHPLLLRETQTALNAARQRTCAAALAPNRHDWRELFTQSDLAYEAWVATNAADEARRDAAMGPISKGELEAAELQRQASVNAFLAARPKPLAALADPAPMVLENIVQTPGEGGAFVTLSGQIRNTGAAPRRANGLMITTRDRFGHVINETLRTPGEAIAPGGVLKFSFRHNIRPALAAEVKVGFRADPPPPRDGKGRPIDPCKGKGKGKGKA